MSAPTASSWQATDPVGAPASLTAIDTVQAWPLGKRVTAFDQSSNARGFGDFIYLTGVASTAAGDAVLVTALYGTTRAAARDKGAIAIALAANTSATGYAWYQTRGKAIVNTSTCTATSPVYLAGSGLLSSNAVTGDQVIGARCAVAEDTNQSVVTLGIHAATADFDNA